VRRTRSLSPSDRVFAARWTRRHVHATRATGRLRQNCGRTHPSRPRALSAHTKHASWRCRQHAWMESRVDCRRGTRRRPIRGAEIVESVRETSRRRETRHRLGVNDVALPIGLRREQAMDDWRHGADVYARLAPGVRRDVPQGNGGDSESGWTLRFLRRAQHFLQRGLQLRLPKCVAQLQKPRRLHAHAGEQQRPRHLAQCDA